METWKATIKEVGVEGLLTPTYTFYEPITFIGGIRVNDENRDYVTRKFLVDFWGLEEPDVEWYELEKVSDIKNI